MTNRAGFVGLCASLWLAGVIALNAPASAQDPAESLKANEPLPPSAVPAPEPIVDARSAAPPVAPAPVQTVKTSQNAALLTPPPPPGTHIPAGTTQKPASWGEGQPRAESDQDGLAKEASDPMGKLGLTLRFGYAAVASGTLNNPTYNKPLATYAQMLPPETLEAAGLAGSGACTPIDPKCRTAARKGFQLALALNVGGSGLGFDLEPYITVGGNAFAAGLYFGPRLEIHLVKGLYLGLGLGARAAYVALDQWKNGGDIFGRIPVHVTYYVTSNVAFVLEGSFGGGISLFVSEPIHITDPRTNKPLATTPKIAVGAARGWDLTLGLRFP